MNKKEAPKVFSIVRNHSGKDGLLRCLNSLFSCSYANMEIIVTDNGTSDGPFEHAVRKFPKIYFIKNDPEISSCAGTNMAIRLALEKMADYVFLIDSETSVDKKCVESLVSEAASIDKNGILSPMILGEDGISIYFSGGEILWKKAAFSDKKSSFNQGGKETDYAYAASMLIDKAVFKKIGLFDEGFPEYFYDLDFCHRAKNEGFEISVHPEAKSFAHKKSWRKNASGQTDAEKSKTYFFKKNASGFDGLISRSVIFVKKTGLLK